MIARGVRMALWRVKTAFVEGEMESTSEVDSNLSLASHGRHGFSSRGKPCPYRVAADKVIISWPAQ